MSAVVWSICAPRAFPAPTNTPSVRPSQKDSLQRMPSRMGNPGQSVRHNRLAACPKTPRNLCVSKIQESATNRRIADDNQDQNRISRDQPSRAAKSVWPSCSLIHLGRGSGSGTSEQKNFPKMQRLRQTQARFWPVCIAEPPARFNGILLSTPPSVTPDFYR